MDGRILVPLSGSSLAERALSCAVTFRWAEEAGFERAEGRGNWFVYTLNFRKVA